MSDPSSTPRYYGENLPDGFFGPDNPVIDGQRWARYPRGYAYNDTGPSGSLFDGSPPLNPMTGKPWRAVILDCPRATNPVQQVGAALQVQVGDAGGGLAFREFLIGPGTPVALALGQYQSVKISIRGRSQAVGTRMAVPARLTWIDDVPFLTNTGLLRAPKINAAAGVALNVPDGAVEVISQNGGGNLIFRDFANNGAASDFQFTAVAAGATVRTVGPVVVSSIDDTLQFLLAGL